MNRHFFYFILTTAFFTVSFMSCNTLVGTDEESAEQIAVNLNANINQLSTYVANNQWESGDEVGLYMIRAGHSLKGVEAIYSDNVSMSLAGQTLAANPPVMYPTSGNVDFVAYYPYTVSVDTSFTIPVFIGEPDSLTTEILYSNNVINQAPTASPVTLNFRYSLAKIQLTIANGANSNFTLADFINASVTVDSLYTQARLDLTDGTLVDYQAKQNVRFFMSSVSDTTAVFEALVIPDNQELTFLFTIGGSVYRHIMYVNYTTETLYKYNFAFDFPNLPSQTVTLLNAVIMPRYEEPTQNISIDGANPALPAP